MSVSELASDDEALQPDDHVLLWRLEQLRELGFNRRQRAVLCLVPDIAHTAAALLAAGCPLETCFDLLS